MIGFYRNAVETTPADHRARRVSRASSHQSPASSLQESRLVAGPLSPSQMCASGRGDRVPNKMSIRRLRPSVQPNSEPPGELGEEDLCLRIGFAVSHEHGNSAQAVRLL
jgi:hypothetical protein